MIELVVNGEDRSVPAGYTISDLLAELELRVDLVVVERNRTIVPRDQYDEVELEAGDTLELVHFVGGG